MGKYVVTLSIADHGLTRAVVDATDQLNAHLTAREIAEGNGAFVIEIVNVVPWDEFVHHDYGLTIIPWEH